MVAIMPPMVLPGVTVQRWVPRTPGYVAVIVHADEDDLAIRLGTTGAAVLAADHASVTELRAIVRYAEGRHHGLEVALVGRPSDGLVPTVWIRGAGDITAELVASLA